MSSQPYVYKPPVRKVSQNPLTTATQSEIMTSPTNPIKV